MVWNTGEPLSGDFIPDNPMSIDPTGVFLGGLGVNVEIPDFSGVVFCDFPFNRPRLIDATLNMSITGGDGKAEMPLHVGGPSLCGGPVVTGVPPSGGANITYISLFTQGPQDAYIPLFIGKDIISSNEIPLYVETLSGTGDPGGSLEQAQFTLAIPSGTEGSSFPTTVPSDIDDPDSANHPTAIPFFISAPLIGSGVSVANLTIISDPAPSFPDNPDGTSADPQPGAIFHSGFMTIAVSGDNASSVTTSQAGDSTLFIGNQAIANSGLLIHMERPTSQMIPLSIRTLFGSGDLPVSISGCLCVASGTTLYMQAPTTKTLNFNLSGYLE